jgi:hypothetical protein
MATTVRVFPNDGGASAGAILRRLRADDGDEAATAWVGKCRRALKIPAEAELIFYSAKSGAVIADEVVAASCGDDVVISCGEDLVPRTSADGGASAPAGAAADADSPPAYAAASDMIPKDEVTLERLRDVLKEANAAYDVEIDEDDEELVVEYKGLRIVMSLTARRHHLSMRAYFRAASSDSKSVLDALNQLNTSTMMLRFCLSKSLLATRVIVDYDMWYSDGLFKKAFTTSVKHFIHATVATTGTPQWKIIRGEGDDITGDIGKMMALFAAMKDAADA